MTPLIGWFSSLVLLATLVNQVWKQWKSGESKGISKWLFLGQLTASIGFTLYSVLVRDWVFVVTNAALTVNAIVGTALFWYRRRKVASAQSTLTEWGPVQP